MRKFLIIILLFCTPIGAVIGSTSPGDFRMYFMGPASVSLGSEISVDILLDASVAINAINIEVSFPKDKLKFIDSNNARSVVDIWSTKPALLADGNISISGGILKSFTGNGVQVLRLTFQGLKEGNARLEFQKHDIYLADGRGTTVETKSDVLTFSIIKTNNKDSAIPIPPTPVEKDMVRDETPPAIVVSLIKNPIDGSSLISFYANDSESGIKEIDMRTKKWFSYGGWINVENPVLHPSGAWKVELRAINNKGLSDSQTLVSFKNLFFKIFMFLIGFALVFIFSMAYNKRSKQEI